MKRIVFALLFVSTLSANAQLAVFNVDSVKKNLKKHISTLASDRFAGRETGTDGERLAYNYLIREFLIVSFVISNSPS